MYQKRGCLPVYCSEREALNRLLISKILYNIEKESSSQDYICQVSYYSYFMKFKRKWQVFLLDIVNEMQGLLHTSMLAKVSKL